MANIESKCAVFHIRNKVFITLVGKDYVQGLHLLARLFGEQRRIMLGDESQDEALLSARPIGALGSRDSALIRLTTDAHILLVDHGGSETESLTKTQRLAAFLGPLQRLYTRHCPPVASVAVLPTILVSKGSSMADPFRGDGLFTAHNALAALVQDPQRLDRARARFS